MVKNDNVFVKLLQGHTFVSKAMHEKYGKSFLETINKTGFVEKVPQRKQKIQVTSKQGFLTALRCAHRVFCYNWWGAPYYIATDITLILDNGKEVIFHISGMTDKAYRRTCKAVKRISAADFIKGGK